MPWVAALVAELMLWRTRTVITAIDRPLALSGFGAAARLYPAVVPGLARFEIQWLPSLGATILLRLDGHSQLFSVLVPEIGALVVIYARSHISAKNPVPRFFA